jgi:hypothetical protein
LTRIGSILKRFYAKAEQRRIERGGWQLLPRLKEQLDRFMAAKAAEAVPSRVNLERPRVLVASSAPAVHYDRVELRMRVSPFADEFIRLERRL